MQILICTDGATKVAKEVASKEEAQAYIDRGFVVEFVGSPVEATDIAPTPKDAPAAPAKKAAAKKAK